MKRLLSFPTAACVSVALICAACTKAEEQPATAESENVLGYKTGNPNEWPAELDAVIAAPGNHKILLENESVRVLEVSLAPNEVEPLHSHRWPSVLYIQEAGHFVDSDADGNVIFDTRALDVPLTFPLTMWKEPEAPHSVTNLSDDTPIRLVRVEIKN
ncbi:hypothetical protein [Hyphococcus sp. DH-69]|uniref:hypothetical protein n=1 Tax=Hyphococcus formosus TaxID=3143534 RepID=UPI00398A918B